MKLGSWVVALGLVLGVGLPARAAGLQPMAVSARDGSVPAGTEEARETAALFSLTRVWEIRLSLTPEAWKAMQPVGEPRFGFGGRGRSARAGGSEDSERSRPPGDADADRPRPPASRQSTRGGLAGRMGLEYPEVRATVLCAGKTYPDVGLRYKGNGTFLDSRGSLKRPLKLDFGQFVKGRRFRGVRTLNLHNNVTDPSFMRESLAYRLFREAGVPAPRTGYARVYLTVPGEHDSRYLGLYTMVEPVDEAFSQRHFHTEKGLLLKPDFVVGLPYMGEDWAAYEKPYRPRMAGEPWSRERFVALTRLLKEADAETLAARIGAFIDLDLFSRFLAVNVLLANMDSILVMGQNFYIYLPSGQSRFVWLPWDLDRAFGNFLAGPDPLTQLSIRQPHSPENLLIDRLLAVPAVNGSYREHLQRLTDTHFTPERLGAAIATIGRVIRPAVAAESPEALRLFDLSLSEKPAEEVSAADPSRRDPSGLRPEGRRASARRPRPAYLKRFVTLRVASVREQLAGRSDGVPTRARNVFGGEGRRAGRSAGGSGGEAEGPQPPASTAPADSAPGTSRNPDAGGAAGPPEP
jgi:hypothetical protein